MSIEAKHSCGVLVKTNNRVHTSFLLALASASLPAQAKAAKADGLKLLISVKSTDDQKENCEAVRSNLLTLIKDHGRFLPRTSGNAAFLFEVRCSSGNLGGRFMVSNAGGNPALVAAHSLNISEPKLMRSTAAVSDLWIRILDKLPWSGEVLKLSKASPPADRPPIAGNVELKAKGIVSLGLNTNNLLGPCIPLDVGSVTPKADGTAADFKFEFPGLLREVEGSQSKFEIYTLNEKVDFLKTYVVRLGDPTKQPKGMIEAMKYCQSKPNAAAPTKVADLMSEVFGSDFVEVNNIKQRYGGALATVRATNGASSRMLGVTYIHNRLLFGGNFMIDAVGSRSLYTKQWTYSGATALTPPEFTNAEVALAVLGRIGKFSGFLGPALTIDKINVPYEVKNPDGSSGGTAQRISIARGGFVLGTSAEFGDRFEYALRLPITRRNGSSYIDFHNILAYRLSATWTTGLDLFFINTGAKLPTEPNANITMLGAFIGVEIGK
jgi:hypothetical protein